MRGQDHTRRTTGATELVTGRQDQDLRNLERHFRAANYLAAAQIYLVDNPLLEESLRPEHIKHRLLGHWGTIPGINCVYAHLNRLILRTDANVLLITGPDTAPPPISPTCI